MIQANLPSANFSRCDLRGTDFSGANLDGANFLGSVFDENTILRAADITAADFSNTTDLSAEQMDQAWFHPEHPQTGRATRLRQLSGGMEMLGPSKRRSLSNPSHPSTG